MHRNHPEGQLSERAPLENEAHPLQVKHCARGGLGKYSAVIMVDEHCYHKHTDSLLERTYTSEASGVSKLITQSQEGL